MFRLFYFLVVFLCFNTMYCSEDQDDNEKNKGVVRDEIIIYTAEGPKKIYLYGSGYKKENEKPACVKTSANEMVDRQADKKQKLNEFEKAELILKAIKDKTIKHKL